MHLDMISGCNKVTISSLQANLQQKTEDGYVYMENFFVYF